MKCCYADETFSWVLSSVEGLELLDCQTRMRWSRDGSWSLLDLIQRTMMSLINTSLSPPHLRSSSEVIIKQSWSFNWGTIFHQSESCQKWMSLFSARRLCLTETKLQVWFLGLVPLCVAVDVIHVSVCFCRYNGFALRSKDLHIRRDGNSGLSVDVSLSANDQKCSSSASC